MCYKSTLKGWNHCGGLNAAFHQLIRKQSTIETIRIYTWTEKEPPIHLSLNTRLSCSISLKIDIWHSRWPVDSTVANPMHAERQSGLMERLHRVSTHCPGLRFMHTMFTSKYGWVLIQVFLISSYSIHENMTTISWMVSTPLKNNGVRQIGSSSSSYWGK